MDIGIDSVWASPSTLHFRVLVWVGTGRYCHKFDAHVAWDQVEIPDLRAVLAGLDQAEPDPTQGLLF